MIRNRKTIAILLVIIMVLSGLGLSSLLNTKDDSNNLNVTPSTSVYSILKTIPTESRPWGILYDNYTNLIYEVDNTPSPYLTIINPSTYQTTNISVAISSSVDYPQEIALASNHNIYIGYDSPSGNVAVFNTSTDSIVKNIAVGGYVNSLVYDPFNHDIYTTSGSLNEVQVIDTSTNSIVGNITVGSNPQSIVLDTANEYLYVANEGSNTVSVINTANSVTSISVYSKPLALTYNSVDNAIYVGYDNNDNVSKIDTSTNAIVSNIDVGSNINSVSALYSTGHDVFTGEGTSIDIINGTSGSIASTISMPGDAYGFAFDPEDSDVYASLFNVNEISVIQVSAMPTPYQNYTRVYENLPFENITLPSFNEQLGTAGGMNSRYVFNTPIISENNVYHSTMIFYLNTTNVDISDPETTSYAMSLDAYNLNTSQIINVSRWTYTAGFSTIFDASGGYITPFTLANGSLYDIYSYGELNSSSDSVYLQVYYFYNHTYYGFYVNPSTTYWWTNTTYTSIWQMQPDAWVLTYNSGSFSPLESAITISGMRSGYHLAGNIADYEQNNSLFDFHGISTTYDTNSVGGTGAPFEPLSMNIIGGGTLTFYNILINVTTKTVHWLNVSFSNSLFSYDDNNNPLYWLNWNNGTIEIFEDLMVKPVDNSIGERDMGYFWFWLYPNNYTAKPGGYQLVLNTTVQDATALGIQGNEIFSSQIIPTYVNGRWTSPYGELFTVNGQTTEGGQGYGLAMNYLKGQVILSNNTWLRNTLASQSVAFMYQIAGDAPYGMYQLDPTSTGADNNWIVVNFGALDNVSVPLPKKYSVTFTESGLPASTTWSVTLNGTTVTGNTSTSNSIVFNMVNGTYSYSIGSVSGYTVSPSSGNITVDGSAASQSVTFTHFTVGLDSTDNPIDVGESDTFTATILSGGVSPYTYTWYNSGTLESSTSSTYATSFSSAGTYVIEVIVTDGSGVKAYDNYTETVSSGTVSISSSLDPADVGDSVTFTASVSDSYTTFSYNWYNDGTLESSTSSTYTTSFPTGDQTYVIEVIATDSAGNKDYYNFTETVYPDPSVSVSSSQNPTDVGNSVTFTVTVTGGTSPYSYKWYNDGTLESSTSSTYVTSFSSSGTYTVEVIVTDANGNKAYDNYSETVNVDPSVTIKSSQNPTDVGNTITFTASGSGGTGSFIYTWYVNGATQSSTSSTLSYSFSSSGIYYVNVTVKDSIGNTAAYSFKETVNSDPSVTVSSSQNPTDVGNSVTFTATGSGGTGSYTYQWYLNGNAVSGATNASYTISFGNAGSDSIYVVLADSVGNKATSSTLTETVNVDPSVTIKSSQNPTDVGNSVTFAATASGGVSPYTYTWYNDGTLGSSTISTYTVSFSLSGSYTIEIIITDKNGNKAYDNFTETVHVDPSVAISSSQNPTAVGTSVIFSAATSGGTGPFAYTWYINSVVQSGNSSSFSHVFSTTGTYNVSVEVSDVYGDLADSNTISESVVAGPTVSVTYSHSPIIASESVTIYAHLSGGVGTYNLTWTFSSETLTGMNATYAFSTAGNRTFSITVSSGSGYSNTHSFKVFVGLKIVISATPSSGYAPLTVDFQAEVLGGSSYLYSWNFGDGATSAAQDTTNTFSVGNYTVFLSVTDSAGVTGNATVLIQSLPFPVSYTFTNNQNITVRFHFTAIPNWDAESPYNMTWKMPNGQIFYGLNISYKFPVYSATNIIKATFVYGPSKTTYITNLTVKMIPATPTVSFSVPSIVPVDTYLALNATATAPDSNSFTFTWDIANTSETGQTQQYYFDAIGNFTISVTVVDSLGASVSVSHVVSVRPVQTNNTISITYVKTSNGPMVYYTVKVLSANGIVQVEALLNANHVTITTINSTYTKAGQLAFYNVTLDQRNYAAGTYPLEIVAYNNNSQSNHITIQFAVTSQYSASTFSLGTIISYFGGLTNFIIIILTIAGVAIAWASLRDTENPDVIVQGQTKKGRTKNIVLKGKKEK